MIVELVSDPTQRCKCDILLAQIHAPSIAVATVTVLKVYVIVILVGRELHVIHQYVTCPHIAIKQKNMEHVWRASIASATADGKAQNAKLVSLIY